MYCTVFINEGAPPYFDKIGSPHFPCKQDPSVLYSATASVSTSWTGKVKEIDALATVRFRLRGKGIIQECNIITSKGVPDWRVARARPCLVCPLRDYSSPFSTTPRTMGGHPGAQHEEDSFYRFFLQHKHQQYRRAIPSYFSCLHIIVFIAPNFPKVLQSHTKIIPTHDKSDAHAPPASTPQTHHPALLPPLPSFPSFSSAKTVPRNQHTSSLVRHHSIPL